MNTCGTCKFFGDERELSEYIKNAAGDYDEQITKYRECGLLKHLNGGKAPQQIAGVIDGSGYFAVLCVTEEFGCNQWAQADGEVKP